jgi:hypothetical protein
VADPPTFQTVAPLWRPATRSRWATRRCGVVDADRDIDDDLVLVKVRQIQAGAWHPESVRAGNAVIGR